MTPAEEIAKGYTLAQIAAAIKVANSEGDQKTAELLKFAMEARFLICVDPDCIGIVHKGRFQ